MANTNLCPGCFNDKGNQNPCLQCGYADNSSSVSSYHLPPGTILQNKYLVGKVLGQGGFGITYLAWDIVLDMKLAIKEFFPMGLVARSSGNPHVDVYAGEQQLQFTFGLDRFLGEAKTLARFSEHPNIVTVRDFFEANNTAYMVMNYMEGETLEEYLNQIGGKATFYKVLEIMMPVMDALREVHHHGIMHRDISPDNIFIRSDGRVILIDFGAARQELQHKSRGLSVIMKLGYSPEEQYRSKGEQGPWTDIYAVAATMYRCLTGQIPPESMDRLADDTLIPPSKMLVEITEEQENALLKALNIRGGSRFQTIEEFQRALIIGNAEAPASEIISKPLPIEARKAADDLSLSGLKEKPITPLKDEEAKVAVSFNPASQFNKKIIYGLGGVAITIAMLAAIFFYGANNKEGVPDESVIPVSVAFDGPGIEKPIISDEGTESVQAAGERSFRVLNADIDYVIHENGLIEVREKRTFSFRGSYAGANQWFSKKGEINFINFAVEENGRYYEFNPGTTYGPPGTFFLKEDLDSILVDWSFEAKDEERSFILHYEMLNALELKNDKVQLYLEFIGDGWEIPTENVSMRLIIPEGASIQEIEAYGYGPSHGTVTIISPNEIIWEIDYLPEKTFIEGRVFFPARLLRNFNN